MLLRPPRSKRTDTLFPYATRFRSRIGVKVLRFSVGFGRALWARRGRDGAEYVIAAIPLGGYVKMLDEREADVDPAEVDQAFNRKSVWRRIAIVAAGPAANLLLCVLLLWAMFVVGRPGYAPVVGHVDGIAAESGLRRGDTVLAVGDRVFQTWDGMQARKSEERRVGTECVST